MVERNKNNSSRARFQGRSSTTTTTTGNQPYRRRSCSSAILGNRSACQRNGTKRAFPYACPQNSGPTRCPGRRVIGWLRMKMGTTVRSKKRKTWPSARKSSRGSTTAAGRTRFTPGIMTKKVRRRRQVMFLHRATLLMMKQEEQKF
ncbi:unnamed protein product [Amoebophrya sp. A120]|nr:unnamed protein product [Amoebophrya sp. A120]|eukprot:GSA120T00001212001.1